jgi:hypothetical protein
MPRLVKVSMWELTDQERLDAAAAGDRPIRNAPPYSGISRTGSGRITCRRSRSATGRTWFCGDHLTAIGSPLRRMRQPTQDGRRAAVDVPTCRWHRASTYRDRPDEVGW